MQRDPQEGTEITISCSGGYLKFEKVFHIKRLNFVVGRVGKYWNFAKKKSFQVFQSFRLFRFFGFGLGL